MSVEDPLYEETGIPLQLLKESALIGPAMFELFNSHADSKAAAARMVRANAHGGAPLRFHLSFGFFVFIYFLLLLLRRTASSSLTSALFAFRGFSFSRRDIDIVSIRSLSWQLRGGMVAVGGEVLDMDTFLSTGELNSGERESSR